MDRRNLLDIRCIIVRNLDPLSLVDGIHSVIYGSDICSIIVNYLFYVEMLGPGRKDGEWVDGIPEPNGIVRLTLYLLYYYVYRQDSFRLYCLNYDLQLSTRIVSITSPDTGHG